jgi:hypothetical protein
LPSPEPKAVAARRSHRDNWRNLILVLKATLKGPRLAPSTRLKIDLEDHGVVGVNGRRPHPIFRPERASPQGYQGLKSGRYAQPSMIRKMHGMISIPSSLCLR